MLCNEFGRNWSISCWDIGFHLEVNRCYADCPIFKAIWMQTNRNTLHKTFHWLQGNIYHSASTCSFSLVSTKLHIWTIWMKCLIIFIGIYCHILWSRWCLQFHITFSKNEYIYLYISYYLIVIVVLSFKLWHLCWMRQINYYEK